MESRNNSIPSYSSVLKFDKARNSLEKSGIENPSVEQIKGYMKTGQIFPTTHALGRKKKRNGKKSSVRGKKNSRLGSKSKSRSNNFKKKKESKHKRRVSLRGGVSPGSNLRGMVKGERDMYTEISALYDIYKILKFDFDPDNTKNYTRNLVFQVIADYYKKKTSPVYNDEDEKIVELLNDIAKKLKDRGIPHRVYAEEVTLQNLHS